VSLEFDKYVGDLANASAEAVISQVNLSNDKLKRWLKKTLTTSEYGRGFLASPVLEATFGWQASESRWRDLEEHLISAELYRALTDEKSEHRVDPDWFVYKHQLEAFKNLLSDPARSAVITSGTGSGKTECFLIPILEDLSRQHNASSKAPLEGVQALMLYPLNALIDSQQERLSAWTSPFGGAIRYCLYSGSTPADTREDAPEQVKSRRRLRESPPPILLTNSTMLEYMLIRKDDESLIEKSSGKLRWIILDEAHTYIGSQAAELALLLRRVMLAFNVESTDVRFVATSATIGNGDQESTDKLQKFLADVAGVVLQQVIVVAGSRSKPPLLGDPDSHPAFDPSNLTGGLLTFEQATAMRERLMERPASLKTLQENHEELSEQDLLASLRSMSLVKDINNDPFLPMRMHLFHRTLPGIWVCINANCSGKDDELNDAAWPWGSSFLNETSVCPCCSSIVFELASCSSCGTEYLKCEETTRDMPEGATSRLGQRLETVYIDEFAVLNSEDYGEADDVIEDVGISNNVISLPRYIAPEALYGESVIETQVRLDGVICDDANNSLLILEPESGLEGFRCSGCHEVKPKNKELDDFFRPVRLGVPFLSLPLVEKTLAHTPSAFNNGHGPKPNLPMHGSRLITFTDSRQGTARLSISQQQVADRNSARSHIYHQLIQHGSSSDDQNQDRKSATVEAAQQELAQLEQHAERDSPLFRSMIERNQQIIAEATVQTQPSLVPWKTLVGNLAQINELARWSLRLWKQKTLLSDVDETQYSDYLLYKEFMRRPKRAVTLETLGLVCLRYPHIENIENVPSEVSKRDITLDEWKALATIAVTVTFRAWAAVDLDPRYYRWLGAPVYLNEVLGPDQEPIEGFKQWPSTARSGYKMSTLVKLIRLGVGLNLDSEVDRQWLDLTLRELWNTITSSTRAVQVVGEGRQLRMSAGTAFAIPESVWQCPYTRKAFDLTFRGISPYTPAFEDNNFRCCQEFLLPQAPNAYWCSIGDEQCQASEWLDQNAQVQKAKEHYLWTGRTDQVVKSTPWFGVGEHSAQQSDSMKQYLVAQFKEGKINVLNCSTTMEMGVDIGGISGVLMNNTPPATANYLQRAGRAGRRGESAALALTLCENSAHGTMVFENPIWPFASAVPVPRVSLTSNTLVQRHLNAYFLALFLKPRTDALKATSGWFFDVGGWGDVEAKELAPADEFKVWLNSETARDCSMAVHCLTRHTSLQAESTLSLLDRVGEALSKASVKWREEISMIREELDMLKKGLQATETSPAFRSVARRSHRLTDEYLLRELANSGFLPSYGFPTDVISFETDTIDDLNFAQARGVTGREDSKSHSRDKPSRDLSKAIHEFAPGADLALAGRIYRSGGLTLNWHIPSGAADVQEIQALNTHWYCKICDSGSIKSIRPSTCPVCSQADLFREEIITPAGFAVPITYKAHDDLSSLKYTQTDPPRLYVNDATWVNLPLATAGRYRYSADGMIIHRNSGANKKGFAICLECGRAEIEETQDYGELPPGFREPHRRLRGGKDRSGESICSGSHNAYSIARHKTLAAEAKTSVFEIQLQNPRTGEPVTDKRLAYSMGLAMRHGLTNHLGLEQSEVDVALQEARSESGSRTISIFLFDTTSGGAGYVEYLKLSLGDILLRAEQLVECSNECETACHSCLLSYSSRHKMDLLDRNLVQDLFASGFKHAAQLESQYHYFGDLSTHEPHPLLEGIQLEMYRSGAQEVTVVLGGETEQWNLMEFDFLNTLRRWSLSGASVHLALSVDDVTSIPLDEFRFLERISHEKNISIEKLSVSPALENEGQLRAIVKNGSGKESFTAWATNASDIAAPGEDWGFTADEPVVRAILPFNPLLNQTQPIDFSRVTGGETFSGKKTIEIDKEIDGSLTDFGNRLFSHFDSSVPELRSLLISKGPAAKITYSDLYLANPLVVSLLISTVLALPRECIDSSTKLDISTQSLGCMRNVNDKVPMFLFDSWKNDAVRRNTFIQLCKVGGWQGGEVNFLEYRSVRHSRKLRVMWADGELWEVSFDHGFGAWKVDRKAHQFSASPAVQAESLWGEFVKVTNGSGFPTELHVGQGVEPEVGYKTL